MAWGGSGGIDGSDEDPGLIAEILRVKGGNVDETDLAGGLAERVTDDPGGGESQGVAGIEDEIVEAQRGGGADVVDVEVGGVVAHKRNAIEKVTGVGGEGELD